jgi:hypothetical protein
MFVGEVKGNRGEKEKKKIEKKVEKKDRKVSSSESCESPVIERKKKKKGVSSSEDKESGSKVETNTRTSLSCIKLQTIKVKMETEKLEKLKSLYKLQEEEEMQEDIGECLNIS